MAQAKLRVVGNGSAKKATRKRYSPAEWQTRLELAAAYRLIRHFGLSDLVYNHLTARIPGTDEEILINPYGLMYDEITASNLLKIDVDGNKLDESPYDINPAGYVIHSAVHKARHDVQCVMHTHSHAATAVSALDMGYVPVSQTGFMFYNRVAYHDYEGVAVNLDERKRLVASLGDKNVLLLRNHGSLTCGATIQMAFRRMYYFELGCRNQLDALTSGAKLRLPKPEVMEHTARQFDGGAAGIGTAETREWPALLRMLDRDEPGWRD